MNAQLVVGWDGSASARRALEWALRQRSGSLQLVQVVDGPGRLGGRTPGAGHRAGDASSIDAVAADAEKAHPGVTVATRVLVGDPVEQLADLAGPDTLLVVGDRLRSILPLRAGWSTGARLVARAAGPVAIIAEDAPVDGSGVLVGVDDSDDARAALAFAADWAADSGQTLHVLHAWRTPFLWSDQGTPSSTLLAEVAAQHAAVVTEAVAEARRRRPELVVDGAEVDGVAARALVSAAPGRSLLVVGDGGVGRIEKLLIGSVSHDVLVNLSIPTVVVGRRAVAARRGEQHGAPREGTRRHTAATDRAGTTTETETPVPTRTIVAWDGSAPSQTAVEWALAREQAGAVEVVMIADEAAAAVGSAAAAAEVALDELTLVHMLEDLPPLAPGVTVHGRVVRGFVLHTLAQLTRPDTLVVIGTEDRRGPRLRFDLSIGSHLPALVRGPIAVVPATLDASRSGVAVGVDGSVLADAAIAVAAAEAARRGQALHLVHAWDEPTLYDSTVLLDSEFVRDLEEDHRRILNAAQARARELAPQLDIETHLVRGDPARALTGLTPRVATVVVGTRGLSGWRRLLLGSTSHQLILNLTVPLIIVGRADGAEPDAVEPHPRTAHESAVA